MESPFEELDGVTEVIAGYTGGHKENPTKQPSFIAMMNKNVWQKSQKKNCKRQASFKEVLLQK